MINQESLTEENNDTEDTEALTNDREGIISTIENLTNRFPKLKALIFTFLTTTAVLTPDISQAHEKISGPTTIEQLDTNNNSDKIKSYLESLNDHNFREVVEAVQEAVANIGEVPQGVMYAETMRYDNLNGTEVANGRKFGTLPEFGTNLVITSERTHGQIEKDSYDDGANSYSAAQSLFSMTEITDMEIQEGSTVEMGGVGTSQAEALQNALAEAIHNFGIDIKNTTELLNQDAIASQTAIKSTALTTAKSQHIISKYHIISSEQVSSDPDKPEFRVTVSVTSGHVLSAQ